MKITIKPPANNTKNILTLLEEAGYTLPCNCHGARLCNGRQYSFDCSMVPQITVTVSLEKETLYFLFRTMETVAWETPAFLATSEEVAFFFGKRTPPFC